MRRIGIYTRVSSDSQDAESQLPDLKEFAAARTAQGDSVAWYDDVTSGRLLLNGHNVCRPGFDRMLQDVRERRIDEVVAWRLDRVGRASIVLVLLETLDAVGGVLRSLREGMDSTTPLGRAMITVATSFAILENDVRRERQTAGIAVAKAAGIYKGGKHGRRVVITSEKEAAVASLFRAGNGPRIIARQTGLSKDSVYRVLRRLELLTESAGTR